MTEGPLSLLVAASPDQEAAGAQFTDLAAAVAAKQVASQGMILVSKNAGGIGARAKLDAARQLGLRVILVDRPAIPPRRSVETVAEVMVTCPQ